MKQTYENNIIDTCRREMARPFNFNRAGTANFRPAREKHLKKLHAYAGLNYTFSCHDAFGVYNLEHRKGQTSRSESLSPWAFPLTYILNAKKSIIPKQHCRDLQVSGVASVIFTTNRDEGAFYLMDEGKNTLAIIEFEHDKNATHEETDKAWKSVKTTSTEGHEFSLYRRPRWSNT